MTDPLVNEDIALVVEDDADIRDIVCGDLEKRGFKPVGVENGTKAFELLQQRAKAMGTARVKIIVSDWMMPGGDGLELLKKIRVTPPFESLPFLLMSGAVSREGLNTAIKQDADGILLKPFVKEQFFKVVQETIYRREQKDVQRVLKHV